MNRTREKLPNANKWCHIYTDIDGVINIHNTETNETYRIIPETSALGFQLERHKDGELRARNTISFDELRILSDLAGSNHLLGKLDDKGGETTRIMPRYFVDIRGGCGAVRDKWHESYDEDYEGLHNDTRDVVEYKHGYTDNGVWNMKQEDIDYLNQLCERLNNEA
jgi:hypothetical protein